MSNYSVVVATCDKYWPALRVFAHLFNKYWSPDQEVWVAGFTPPPFDLPSNFKFMSIGPQDDYPVTKWTDAILAFLDEMESLDVFPFFLEDYWLVRPVDLHAVQMLVDYMRDLTYVARIDLTTDRFYSDGPRYPLDIPHYGYCGYLDLIKSRPHSQYHCSLIAGLWRRTAMQRTLQPGWTPWQVELDGTPVLSDLEDALVLGTRSHIVKHILAHRGGDTQLVNLDQLNPKDVQELEDLGYISWEK